MHRTRLFFALQCVLWGIPLPADAANTEMALNSVWLNGVDRVIETRSVAAGWATRYQMPVRFCNNSVYSKTVYKNTAHKRSPVL